MNKITEWVKANKGTAIALALIAGAFFYSIGCESTTLSLDGTREVNRTEFIREGNDARAALVARDAELTAQRAAINADTVAFNANLEDGVAELDEKDEQKAEDFNVSIGLLATGANSLAPGTGTYVLTLGTMLSGVLLGRGVAKKVKEKRAAA